MNNDFVRKQLGINTTVGPMSNYIAKPAERIFVEDDSRLAIARGLEYLNPKLKVWADNRENELIAKGYEEGNRIAEESGSMDVLKEKQAELERQDWRNAGFNPYVKRFVDRRIASELARRRQEEFSEYYINDGLAKMSQEEFQNASMKFNSQWMAKNKPTIDKLDKRETTEVLYASTETMNKLFRDKHIEDTASRLIEARGQVIKNDFTEMIEGNLDNVSLTQTMAITSEEALTEEDIDGQKRLCGKDKKGKFFLSIERNTGENQSEISVKNYFNPDTNEVINVVRVPADRTYHLDEDVENFIPVQYMKMEVQKALEAGEAPSKIAEYLQQTFKDVLIANPDYGDSVKAMAEVMLKNLTYVKKYTPGGKYAGERMVNDAEIGAFMTELDNVGNAAYKVATEKRLLEEKENEENISKHILRSIAYDDKYRNMSPNAIVEELKIDPIYIGQVTQAQKLYAEGSKGSVTFKQTANFSQYFEDIALKGKKYSSRDLVQLAKQGEIHINDIDRLITAQEKYNGVNAGRLNSVLSGLYSLIDEDNSLNPDQKFTLRNAVYFKVTGYEAEHGKQLSNQYEVNELFTNYTVGIRNNAYIRSGEPKAVTVGVMNTMGEEAAKADTVKAFTKSKDNPNKTDISRMEEFQPYADDPKKLKEWTERNLGETLTDDEAVEIANSIKDKFREEVKTYIFIKRDLPVLEKDLATINSIIHGLDAMIEAKGENAVEERKSKAKYEARKAELENKIKSKQK